MQDDKEGKFKELHCGNCNKYMGYKNIIAKEKHHIILKIFYFFFIGNKKHHDFFGCCLKCVNDWQSKQKVKDFQVEHLKE